MPTYYTYPDGSIHSTPYVAPPPQTSANYWSSPAEKEASLYWSSPAQKTENQGKEYFETKTLTVKSGEYTDQSGKVLGKLLYSKDGQNVVGYEDKTLQQSVALKRPMSEQDAMSEISKKYSTFFKTTTRTQFIEPKEAWKQLQERAKQDETMAEMGRQYNIAIGKEAWSTKAGKTLGVAIPTQFVGTALARAWRKENIPITETFYESVGKAQRYAEEKVNAPVTTVTITPNAPFKLPDVVEKATTRTLRTSTPLIEGVKYVSTKTVLGLGASSVIGGVALKGLSVGVASLSPTLTITGTAIKTIPISTAIETGAGAVLMGAGVYNTATAPTLEQKFASATELGVATAGFIGGMKLGEGVFASKRLPFTVETAKPQKTTLYDTKLQFGENRYVSTYELGGKYKQYIYREALTKNVWLNKKPKLSVPTRVSIAGYELWPTERGFAKLTIKGTNVRYTEFPTIPSKTGTFPTRPFDYYELPLSQFKPSSISGLGTPKLNVNYGLKPNLADASLPTTKLGKLVSVRATKEVYTSVYSGETPQPVIRPEGLIPTSMKPFATRSTSSLLKEVGIAMVSPKSKSKPYTVKPNVDVRQFGWGETSLRGRVKVSVGGGTEVIQYPPTSNNQMTPSIVSVTPIDFFKRNIGLAVTNRPVSTTMPVIVTKMGQRVEPALKQNLNRIQVTPPRQTQETRLQLKQELTPVLIHATLPITRLGQPQQQMTKLLQKQQITPTQKIQTLPKTAPPPYPIKTKPPRAPPPISIGLDFHRTKMARPQLALPRLKIKSESKKKLVPMPDLLSITQTEAKTFKQASYPMPTPKIKSAFKRRVEKMSWAWRFPTAEQIAWGRHKR